jgi:hypothetical protein
MSQTLVIPDELYARLSETARQRGLHSVEELLAEWRPREEAPSRDEAVQTINNLRARLFAAYGEMPDSTELIREDRNR